MGYEVHVLHAGYSGTTDQGMVANCSCTLVRGRHNIIVDTMTPWDKDRIISALARHKLTPDDIHFVVCTHGHSDHIGNNNLFLCAKHIVGFSVSFRDVYSLHPFEEGQPFVIDDDVKVIPTPGHTNTDVSVIVRTREMGTVAIVGDLFEREEDLQDSSLWREVGGSENPRSQERYRNAILLMADHIVPGHGPMFAVTASVRDEANKKTVIATGQVNYLPPSFINSGFGPPVRNTSHSRTYTERTSEDHWREDLFKTKGLSNVEDRVGSMAHRDWNERVSSCDIRAPDWEKRLGLRVGTEWSSKLNPEPRTRDLDSKPVYESGSRTLDDRIGRDESFHDLRAWENRTKTTDERLGREARKRTSENKLFREDGTKMLMERPLRDDFDRRPDDMFVKKSSSRFSDDNYGYEDRHGLGERSSHEEKIGFGDKFREERLCRDDRQGVIRDDVRFDRVCSGDRLGLGREDRFSREDRIDREDKLGREVKGDLRIDRCDRLSRDDRIGKDDKVGRERAIRDDKTNRDDRLGREDRLRDEKARRDSRERGREDWSRVDRNRAVDNLDRREIRTKFSEERASETRNRSSDDRGSKSNTVRVVDDKLSRRDDRFKREPLSRETDEGQDRSIRARHGDDSSARSRRIT